ncbi:MAG: hypothetical protein LPK58_06120 [Gammaproteobacteria bacterium]|mgnify:FL=1|nr:hypothetical protein [Gammaproteobacteria bacterium]MDX5375179.1 hypothetical protein [Gammaproteobacteria bacterium]
MNDRELNQRCVELMQNPDVMNHMWHPRMFWETRMKDNPTPDELVDPKVDLLELEVMLAEVAHVPSACAAELERREPGRADLIRHMIRRGDMPFLHRPH